MFYRTESLVILREIDYFQEMKNKIYVTIKDNGLNLIPIKSLLAVESDDHYTAIYYTSDDKIGKLYAWIRLEEWEKILPKEFVKLSRFQIINTSRVLKAHEDIISFEGGLNFKIKSKVGLKFFYFTLSIALKPLK